MKNKAYKRFRFRLITLAVLAALTPLLVLAAVLYFRSANNYSRQMQEQIWYQVQARARAIDQFLQQQTALLAMLADTHSFDALTRQSVLSESLATLNRRSGAFLDLALIDANGRQQAYAGPFDQKDRNYGDQTWFTTALTNGAAISDQISGDRKPPHVLIAVSRLDRTPSWVLTAAIDSDALHNRVRSTYAENSGDDFLVNRAGINQTQPLAGGKASGLSSIDTSLFSKRTSVIEHRDAEGRKIQVGGSWLTQADWLLVITRPTDQAMQPLLHLRNLALIIIFAGLILIGLVAFIHTTVTVRILEDAAMRRQELEDQLLQTYKLAALGKIAADIVHEINNPVAVISEKAGWMKDLLPDARFQPAESRDEFQTSIASIEEQVQRIQQIVRNILGFARRMEDHVDEVNVNTVLDQTADLLQDQSRANHISIRRELDPDLPVIPGDPSQLQQVFTNLIHNAMDAIGKNGNIHLSSRRADGFIEIDFRDDGPGISHTDLGKIFDPFFTTKPSGKGTGLGLSICHTIVKQMGGVIRVDSVQGEGTTFTVRLAATLPRSR